MKRYFTTFIALLALAGSKNVLAQEEADTTETAKVEAPKKNFANLHFQTTYIYQYKPAFAAQYSGPNSLKTNEEKVNSITSTLYLGVRLWKGAELYINPEIAGGSGLSGAFGMAASTNGETFRVGDPAPSLYLARGVLYQTIGFGQGRESIDEGTNEIGGDKPKDYLKLFAGKISLGDVFDNNAYAASPRTQFINWCLMSNGAWDYAANLRGYTYAAGAVVKNRSLLYKIAVATLPVVANGMDLNTDLSQEYGINGEVDKSYTLKGARKGNLRLYGYYNNGHMGSYSEALTHIDSTGVPNVIATRKYGRTKSGICLNMDQQIDDNSGVFLRAGWNDGLTETWAFTEADRTISAGMSLGGQKWKRKDDILMFAIVANGLSSDHKAYLKAGGLGFQLGDTKLNYGLESVLEAQYNCKANKNGIWLSADYQFVLNPGYNMDRGPVNVFSFRAHVEL